MCFYIRPEKKDMLNTAQLINRIIKRVLPPSLNCCFALQWKRQYGGSERSKEASSWGLPAGWGDRTTGTICSAPGGPRTQTIERGQQQLQKLGFVIASGIFRWDFSETRRYSIGYNLLRCTFGTLEQLIGMKAKTFYQPIKRNLTSSVVLSKLVFLINSGSLKSCNAFRIKIYLLPFLIVLRLCFELSTIN